MSSELKFDKTAALFEGFDRLVEEEASIEALMRAVGAIGVWCAHKWKELGKLLDQGREDELDGSLAVQQAKMKEIWGFSLQCLSGFAVAAAPAVGSLAGLFGFATTEAVNKSIAKGVSTVLGAGGQLVENFKQGTLGPLSARIQLLTGWLTANRQPDQTLDQAKQTATQAEQARRDAVAGILR